MVRALAGLVILAVMADLMFSVKIIDVANKLGMPVQFVKDRETALRKFEPGPTVIVFDLNFAAADPLGLIRHLKADPATRLIPTLAFVSHVQVELRRHALEAGCDVVVARSVFAQKLPELLAPYAG